MSINNALLIKSLSEPDNNESPGVNSWSLNLSKRFFLCVPGRQITRMCILGGKKKNLKKKNELLGITGFEAI